MRTQERSSSTCLERSFDSQSTNASSFSRRATVATSGFDDATNITSSYTLSLETFESEHEFNSQKTAVQTHPSRVLPSMSEWLLTAEIERAAAFSQTDSYASFPPTLVCGRASAEPRRPMSRMGRGSPKSRDAMERASSRSRYVIADLRRDLVGLFTDRGDQWHRRAPTRSGRLLPRRARGVRIG